MAVFGSCVFRQPDIVLVALELAFFCLSRAKIILFFLCLPFLILYVCTLLWKAFSNATEMGL
jgi:hypothetical protein